MSAPEALPECGPLACDVMPTWLPSKGSTHDRAGQHVKVEESAMDSIFPARVGSCFDQPDEIITRGSDNSTPSMADEETEGGSSGANAGDAGGGTGSCGSHGGLGLHRDVHMGLRRRRRRAPRGLPSKGETPSNAVTGSGSDLCWLGFCPASL